MKERLPKNQLKTTTADGVPLAVGSMPVLEKMFFYERPNGSIFNTSEKDAIRIHKKMKFLGVSNGDQYVATIKELQAKFKEMTMAEIQEAMREAWRREVEIARGNLTPPMLKPLNLGIAGQIQLQGARDEIN